MNGQRADANYFTVDGVSANFGVTGYSPLVQAAGGALPALSAQGGTNSLVSVDAMQEFRVQTSSFAPELGRTPGGQISIVTRSGSNQFHGTAFEYFRNDVLDANDWFSNRDYLPKPEEWQDDGQPAVFEVGFMCKVPAVLAVLLLSLCVVHAQGPAYLLLLSLLRHPCAICSQTRNSAIMVSSNP